MIFYNSLYRFFVQFSEIILLFISDFGCNSTLSHCLLRKIVIAHIMKKKFFASQSWISMLMVVDLISSSFFTLFELYSKYRCGGQRVLFEQYYWTNREKNKRNNYAFLVNNWSSPHRKTIFAYWWYYLISFPFTFEFFQSSAHMEKKRCNKKIPWDRGKEMKIKSVVCSFTWTLQIDGHDKRKRKKKSFKRN